MDEARIRERICRAVDQRCQTLTADPFLAARVMRMAEEKGDRRMKKKLSTALVVCIVLMLLSLTALAAALLTGMEIVDQQAVPVAQQNDGEVRVNGMYSYEELVEIVAIAGENGISVENDPHLMEALARHEGYYEEELIMTICREAFGGLFYEWDVEEKHWYGEKMVEIGFADENPYRLPGDGEIPPQEARALAVTLLEAEFGPLPVTDPAQYRAVEDFDEGGWYFTFHPRSMTAPEYSIHFSHDRTVVEATCTPQSWETFTEAQLADGVSDIYGYRTYTQQSWGLQGWYVFGQMLPQATHSGAWSAVYDGYLATTYLLPQPGDITADEAKAIAMADVPTDIAIDAELLLLGRDDARIWKVTLRFLQDDRVVTQAWEIDAGTGAILHRMPFDATTPVWASYMLHETLQSVQQDVLSAEEVKALAIADLRERFGDPTLPLDDPACYDVTVRAIGNGQRYSVIFNPRSIHYGKCFVWVNADGSTELEYANLGPLNADNLHDRMDETIGSSLQWDQSHWVEFDRLQETLGEPLTFEGRLFAATVYPEASAAAIPLEKALDVVQLDLGNVSDEPICWVLIAGENGPVWKIRMGTWPANTLYEVDATTGEILDREIFVCQNPDFDHDMKMFTLRSVYMPAALAEFGPVRIAMELTVKSDFNTFSYDETVFMNPACYEITVEGMTVTFRCVDGGLPSYRTTILNNGMDADIEVFDVPDPNAGNG